MNNTPIKWLKDEGLVDICKVGRHEVMIFAKGREHGLTGQPVHQVVIGRESRVVVGDLEMARAIAIDRLAEMFVPEAREHIRILNEEQAQVELARLGVGS